MSIPAGIDTMAPFGTKSSRARRKLRLQLQGTKASGIEVEVLVHNISAAGLLLEGNAGAW
ncbi:hypothetical protein [Sphingopyxis sp.]|jgi:hypothetical protein|uniref:hypothetical protein n=1 Tax=Sphingopyxis sp. TaxID=1908224 RepID=UPI0025D239B3|nr:hypothetical protein [Sphingopyxis sp.]MBK6411747.1 hypothetical protein [Sphingopyxis sp.]